MDLGKKRIKGICGMKLGYSDWWTRDFYLRAQGNLRENCESLEVAGKILNVFTLTFSLGG